MLVLLREIVTLTVSSFKARLLDENLISAAAGVRAGRLKISKAEHCEPVSQPGQLGLKNCSR
jgi:hypothetical protein